VMALHTILPTTASQIAIRRVLATSAMALVATMVVLGSSACKKAEPAMVDIEVYFIDWPMMMDGRGSYGDMAKPVVRQVPASDDIAAVAVREMLKGPTPEEQERGFETAMPDDTMIGRRIAGIAEYKRQHPTEEIPPGNRYTHGAVELLSLRIEDGTAYADFSNEIHAYGGGSAPSGAIPAQIRKTLQQFLEIDAVVISVESRTAVILQP